MRCLASGVSLISTRGTDGNPHGLVATSVVSVSAEPPILLVCVNRSASMHDHLVGSGSFCVNFLGDRHEPLSRRFSSAADRRARFSDPIWTRLETGAPVLKDALAALDCRVTEMLPATSHSIFLGAVLGVAVASMAVPPLVYFDGRYRQLGAEAA